MMEKNQTRRVSAPGFAKVAALVLAAVLLCAAAASRPARAAEWMQPYLDQVRAWGVMRGDANGNMNEDRPITRAEFVTLVNRAFGYTEVGPHTFTDVQPGDWFAEDISIAHNVGYFQGTSPNTASPMNLVTREQAAVLLGRSLRLQGVTGAANSTFTDVQNIGGWSRGLVQEAADLGIIQGYSDGTFRPEQNVTRGQMACFLVRALGTLIQEPGEQVSGGVYGNMTITTPGVKLKDTTITGNLYLSGGVGLGNVELENVEVLGKIIVCGGGEAEKGDHSIILRNVIAPTLEVDSITGQFLSVQAEGLTDIGEVTVRTPSFVQDLTEDGLGFQNIRLDGDGEFEGGVQLQLAGNIKNVVNLTPNSELQMAQGVANVVTIDEKAIDSALKIDNIASIKELNLDRGTEVTGEGGISHVNINAPGSNVAMLPDTIFVRPGITGNVNRVNMDNKIAEESSEDPRLLAGYPYAKNVAPTSADAVFSTNKQCTVYWGLTALMDGSLGEEELMNPTNFSAKIIRNGTVAVRTSNTEVTARLTGLTRSGSYYISAMAVDARGRRSPVKVTAFTTPDDTAPNFSTGYPQAPILTTDADNEQIAQIMVMATKSCQMYYALMPKGSAAPTAADFRAGAIPGNLGSGIVTLRKNTPFLLSRINSTHLAEQTQYDLYLWLSDADNGKSSAVRRVQITTKDLTPPTIQHITVTDIQARSVRLSFALDEPGMLYWAVVKHNDGFYAPGIDPKDPGRSGKIQIENGVAYGGVLVRKGGPVRVARAGVDGSFNVTGLEAQTAYDLYYVAKDTAGNYCEYTKALTPPMQIHTLDNEPPTVKQEFTNIEDETAARPRPYPDTDVNIVFSEQVVPIVVSSSGASSLKELTFEEAYRGAQSGDAEKVAAYANLLRDHIKLYYGPVSNRAEMVPERRADNESTIKNWVIDYRKVQISQSSEGEMVFSFPYGEAINLTSGDSYYFLVSNVADNSDAHHRLKYTAGNRDGFVLPLFTVVDAQLVLDAGAATGNIDGVQTMFDMNFSLTPEGTANVNGEILWDMIFWAEETLTFDLYCDDGGWHKMGSVNIETNAQQPHSGVSYSKQLLTPNLVPDFEPLNQFSSARNYGIIITKRGDSTDRDTWAGEAKIRVLPIAGNLDCLVNLADRNLTPETYAAHQKSDYAVNEIGTPKKDRTLSKSFTDTAKPTFMQNYPKITTTDSSVSINIMVSGDNCKYFCVISEIDSIPPTTITTKDGRSVDIDATTWGELPMSGQDLSIPTAPGNADPPSTYIITNGTTLVPPDYIIRNGTCGRRVTTVSVSSDDEEGGLKANTQYVAYFVLQGDDIKTASKVYAFGFKTELVTRPALTVTLRSPKGIIQANREAQAWYALVTAGTTEPPFSLKLKDCATVGVNGWTADMANGSLGNTSVLEAMTLDNPNGQGSLFDAYADLQNSNTMQIVNIVKTTGSSGGTIPVSGGPVNLTSRNNLRTEIDFSQYLVNNAEYWLVAVGQCQGTSGHAFRANRYLRNADSTPPQVNSLDTSLAEGSPIYDISERAKAITEPYSGTISISFTEALYYRVSSEVRKQIVDAMNVADPQDRYMSSISLLGRNNPKFNIECKEPDSFDRESPPDCMNLVISFTNCTEGTTLTFDSNLCDSQNNPGARPLALTLKLVEETSGTGANRVTLLRPTFEFSNSQVSSIWQGRVSTR